MTPHFPDGPAPFDEAIRCVEELALQRRPGERMPSERELAEQLAISRLTVREALRTLAARGLVELSQGRRAVVRDPSSAVLAGYFSVSMRREPRSLMELLTIRRALEGLSASTAARSATRTGVDLLESTVHQMAGAAERLDAAEPGTVEAATALEDYVSADLAFHGTLAVVGGNSLLGQLLEGLADALGQAFQESVRGHRARGGNHAAVVQQHRKVVEAVRRGDPVAATAAMERHLTETASDLRAAGQA